MKLSLFVDIYNRKLVKSATSDFPVDLPTLFREDWIDLEITLVEPSGTITSPQTVVDVSSISIKAAIGNPDSDPEAFQNTFTKDTANNKYTGTLNINTTEMEQAFTAASGNTIDRYFEIEVEGPSNHFHTVLQKSITLHKDVIVNATVAPTDVTSGSAFATSFAATATDSTTIEWTKSGDSNYAHLKGTSGLSALTASKYVKVKSDASGFELADATGAASAMDDLTDVDTSTAAPSTGDHIKWDGTNWVPTSDPPTHTHTYALNDLSNVTAGSPSSGQVLAWNGSAWVPDTNTAPNLWATVTGDSGTTTADSTTDSLKVAGGEGMTTSVAGDVVTVDGEDATDTNKGIAKFKSTDFTVTNGEVALDAVSIANGGTGQASAESAFDALAPTTTAGDLIQMNAAGTDNERLAIGSAGQVLTVNSGGTQAEWAAASGGGGSASDSFKTISVSGQSDVVADSSTDTLTLVAGSNVTLTTDASADSVTIAASGGSTSPAGSNTQVQFNNSGSFGASSDLVWNGNHIVTKGVSYNVATDSTSSGTVTLDFDGGQLIQLTSALGGDITFAASNMAAGKVLSVKMVNGGSSRTLTFPTNWKFVGAKPTTIAASKTAVLALTAYGTAEADVVAAWAVES